MRAAVNPASRRRPDSAKLRGEASVLAIKALSVLHAAVYAGQPIYSVSNVPRGLEAEYEHLQRQFTEDLRAGAVLADFQRHDELLGVSADFPPVLPFRVYGVGDLRWANFNWRERGQRFIVEAGHRRGCADVSVLSVDEAGEFTAPYRLNMFLSSSGAADWSWYQDVDERLAPAATWEATRRLMVGYRAILGAPRTWIVTAPLAKDRIPMLARLRDELGWEVENTGQISQGATMFRILAPGLERR